MRVAHLVIALGCNYRPYFRQLLHSANKHFVPHTTVVWTDDPFPTTDGVIQIHQGNMGFPEATLQRYRLFSEQASLLANYDQLFYTDVDMTFVAPVGAEVFSNGITATLHPGYIGTRGTPERNPISRAYIPRDARNRYFCGGFNGGDARTFLSMAKELSGLIDEDSRNGITAVWHDESHLNRYLFARPPAKVLSPDYCYPEGDEERYKAIWAKAGLVVEPKILALDKGKKL